jgi:phosphoribosylformylglycinamidine synthase
VTPIPVTPTLLGVGIVNDIRKCATTDLKRAGHALYHAGDVRDEMGGSHYYAISGGESTQVPSVKLDQTRKYAEAVVTAIEAGIVAAAHDVGMGGLVVAVAEMCMGGDLGAQLDLGAMGKNPSDVKLFSESSTRWILEATDQVALEAHFRAHGAPLQRIGVVGGDRIEIKDGPAKKLVDVKVAHARREFVAGLPRRMG